MKIFKAMSVMLLNGMGFSGGVSAHDYLGGLGSAASVTDKWYFQCLNPNTAKVTFQILRTSGTDCVGAYYIATRESISSCGGWSNLKTVTTGSGAKFFTIYKAALVPGTFLGARSYTVRARCLNKDGSLNPSDQTSPQVYLRNQ